MNKLRLDIVPPTSTSQGGGKRMMMVHGKPMFFKSAAQKSATETYAAILAFKKPGIPAVGAVGIKITFVFPWRSKDSKKTRQDGEIYKTTKPDCDNMAKALIDVMTQLRFWEDDAQIADIRIIKKFGNEPRVEIEWGMI